MRQRLGTLLRRFWRETGGAIAVWAALFAPVLIGGAALSVDVSRMYNLEQELQLAADALARAGAAELDQRSDSLSRANRAIANLVSNSQKFGDQGLGEVKPNAIRFLKSLPANDYDIPGAEHETTEPYEARYVEVVVIPETVNVLFSKALASNISSVTLEAKSIAGAENGVCGTAPLFVCNPYENTETSIYEAMEDPAFQRRLVQIKTPSKNTDLYGPGNFGFLDPYGIGSGNIDDAIALVEPPICFTKSPGVDLKTGNRANLRFAFNTRFDIYAGDYKKHRNNPLYAPAANVTKGYSGKACTETPDPNAMGLPRDDCFSAGNCPYMDGRQGTGDWDFVSYMEINHNAVKSVVIDNVTYNLNYNSRKSLPKTPPSRYQVYRWEIDTGSIPGAVSYGTSSTPEEGTPQCHGSGPATDVDRRILYIAVLNCEEIEATIGMNGSRDSLPVETFAKVFVTEPMGTGKGNTIWGEIVGPVVKGRDSVAKDRVIVAR